ncbi:hypothetical protein JRO89_XS07G0131500 [Xanthoceras sorbifolium]|uniref:VQ domain-containing protein n=1 Tax=Xanthoceras sorbifolium TaxID=99658 RepID=A0ABQ8HTP9_9ROSI|nr:hypothetical protein JRO89_XS07G0131500 [Xanthoceras sorbifolium]
MDKSCHSSGDSNSNTTTATTSNRDHYLKHLNKLSHKISKQPSSSTTTNTITAPLIKKPTTFDHQNPNQPPQSQQNLQPPPPQHQPPVYNINKNDFRDVVQKLTGSPAHERFSTPPPIHQPKPPSSRLQRIRPPPLAQVSNRPPSMLSCANPPIPPPNTTTNNNNSFIQRPAAPLSPLPPFPSVHAAAESPVSAYMRYLQNSIPTSDPNSKPQFSGFSPLAPLVSPRWSNLNATSQQQQEMIPPPGSQPQMTQSQQQFQLPSSPLPFGCLNSPRSSYPLLSPSMLFSPSSGQLNFPLSPTVPVPSPRWRGL